MVLIVLAECGGSAEFIRSEGRDAAANEHRQTRST